MGIVMATKRYLEQFAVAAGRGLNVQKSFFCFCLSFLLTVGGIPALPSSIVMAQQPQILAETLVSQGQQHYRQGDFRSAIRALSQAAETYANQGSAANRQQAITLTNLGNSQLAIGDAQAALTSWKQATRLFTQLGNAPADVTRSQLDQTRALNALGLYPQACNLMGVSLLNIDGISCETLTQSPYLTKTLEQFQQQPKGTASTGLRSLGDVFRAVGELEASERVLKQATEIDGLSPEAKAAIQLSLGNTYRAHGNLERDRRSPPVYDYLPWRYVSSDEAALQVAKPLYQEASDAYNSALDVTSQAKSQHRDRVRVHAQLNLLNLLMEQGDLKAAEALSEQLALDSLPAGQTSIFAQLNFAKQLVYLSQLTPHQHWRQIQSLLTTARQSAQRLEGGETAQSYVLGNLAGFYEYCSQQPEHCQTGQSDVSLRHEAQSLTEQALLLAQPNQSPEIAYQWQWQLGRLLAEQGEREGAIAAYEAATDTLDAIRKDLIRIDSDVQFSFRDNVEPIYRGLVSLLLSGDANDPQPSQASLKRAIQDIDALQLTELENFVRCNTTDIIDLGEVELAPRTATLHPIMLPDRLAVILDLPGNSPIAFSQMLDAATQTSLGTKLQRLRQSLEDIGNEGDSIPLLKELYQGMIEPFEAELEANEIETLVFVLDGALRNLPMAALFDGKTGEYLIDRYEVAISPRFKVFEPNPLPTGLQAFMGGTSEEQTIDGVDFSKIELLEEELSGIGEYIETATSLVDDEFTQKNIEDKLRKTNFSVVHLKTHGVFSSNPEDNFIVGYGGDRITGRELGNLLQQASREKEIELITLSACSTAEGDSRAVLGLAGISVQAGARSVLSTLWKADDRANTEFMQVFYEALSLEGATRAWALQSAILALKELEHDPHLWAPYILVGNWL